MDELAKFKDQLAYVNVSLEADPENDDLLKLKSELVELIELTEQTLPAPTADKGKAKAKLPPNTAAPGEKAGQAQGVFRPGEDCMARYKDGKL
jgi:survival-of-motor-neuron-related-splicing factor 30